MEHVAVDDVEPAPVNPALHILTDPLGTTDVAINRYDVVPGGQVGGGYHTHHDQEEVFYVESGVLTFETEDGDGDVGPGEVVRFPPGEFHHGYNDGDQPVRLLAIGAPRDSEDVESVRECTACGAVFHHHRTSFMGSGFDADDPARQVACPECGGETRRIGRPDSGRGR